MAKKLEVYRKNLLIYVKTAIFIWLRSSLLGFEANYPEERKAKMKCNYATVRELS